MTSILKNAKNYQRVPFYVGTPRHIYDPYTVPPQVLKIDPKTLNKEKKGDDISVFPK